MLLFALPSLAQAPESLGPLLRKFVNVLALVQREGASPGDIDQMIYAGAIPAMLRPLDPHTQFFDSGQFDQLKQMQSAEQKGFGSIVSVLPGRVLFLQTLPGTPSAKAGIQAGDELLAIGSVIIGNLEPNQIVELLTQARQQKIAALVRRPDASRPLQFTLEPALVDAPSVDRTFPLSGNTGYIRIAGWEGQTSRLLEAAIRELGGDRLHGLVLDLRNNPGGVVTAALEAASLFLKPGQQIMSARGRGSETQTADVPKTSHPFTMRIAVLVNSRTASASEIFAGALQDHDRATIVGEPSYGKGLVQSVLPLSNGTGLALTTAFYYTPSGRSIQHPLRDSALSTTFLENRTENTRPTYKTDSGRTVRGGGGIEPDIHADPASMTRLEQALAGSGVITSFATEYLRRSAKLPDPMTITPAMLDDLKVYASGHDIQPTVAEWSSERTWLAQRLEEELVTQAQGVARGDEVAAKGDPQIQTALQALR